MKLVHKGDLKHAKKRLQTLRELVEGGPASDESKEARKLYRANQTFLEHVPASSPDLAPVEKFWGWLR